VTDRDLGARTRDQYRTREQCRDRDQYRDREQYRGRELYRDMEQYRDRDYRERDRDFGEIVFLEREGEMLAHFQAGFKQYLLFCVFPAFR